MAIRKRQQNDSTVLMENGANVKESSNSNLKGDEQNIALLFFLYTLQGIPLGLAAAIPMILQNRGVSYRQQVCFFFIYYFSRTVQTLDYFIYL